MPNFINNLKASVGLRGRETKYPVGVVSGRVLTSASLFSGKTGIYITPETSLNMSTVYSAVTLLTGACSSLPVEKFRLIDDKGNRQQEHDLFTYIINNRPNTDMNMQVFNEVMIANLLLRGNAYAERELNSIDEPIAYWPIPSAYITPMRMTDGSVWYAYIGPDGTRKLLPPEKILHIKDFSLDGVVGLSRITLARLSIELGLAQEALSLSLMANDAKTSGIIEAPLEMSEEDVKAFKDEWEKKGQSLFNKGKTIILEKGLQYKPVAISPKDAEFIASRQFQVQEIARWFRVPPHMLYELTRSTYSNINMQSQEFSTYSLLPILNRFIAAYMYDQYVEKDIKVVLRTKKFKQDIVLSYNMDNLLNADPRTRHDIYKIGTEIGMYSPNDCLRGEHKDTIGKEGDIRTVNTSRIPLDKVGQNGQKPPRKTPISDGIKAS